MTGSNARSREQVFAFIVQYKREHDGLSPTAREIAEACFMHESTARYHVTQLALHGRIRLIERRGIEVVGGAWEPPDSGESKSGGEAADEDAAAAQDE